MKGLRGGPAPLTLASLGRWASIAAAAAPSGREIALALLEMLRKVATVRAQ
jgi:hypothetical protein